MRARSMSMHGLADATVDPANVEDEANLLEELSLARDFTGAWCVGGEDSDTGILVAASQRSLLHNRKRQSLLSFVESGSGFAGGFGFEVPADCLAFQPSPSGELVLLARKATDAQGGKKTGASFVWELIRKDGQLIKSFHIPTKVHGEIYAAGYFSNGIQWSSDEQLVAYVAETPPKTRTPHWGTDGVARLVGSNDGEGSKPGLDECTLSSWQGKGRYEEEWGEQFEGKTCAGVYLLDVSEGEIYKVEPEEGGYGDHARGDEFGGTDDMSCGKPAFSPDGELLAFTVWPHSQPWAEQGGPPLAKKLGAVYCYNRQCHVEIIRVNSVVLGKQCATRITSGPGGAASSAHTPAFSKAGDNVLYFLSHSDACETGAHNACAALYKTTFDMPEGDVQRGFGNQFHDDVVQVVRTPESPESFQGLYCADIKQEAVMSCEDGDIIYLTSVHRCNAVILAVHIATREVRRVTPANESWVLIGAGRGKLVASRSVTGQPPCVFVSPMGDIQWKILCPKSQGSEAQTTSSALTKVYEVLPAAEKTAFGEPARESSEAVLLLPENAAQTGGCVLLVPHGGPHSAHTCGWNMQHELLLNLGYSIVLVNYRGSIGYGADSLLSLQGHIGDWDVHDCVRALDVVLEDNPDLDASRVAVMGGSHGGFLTLHLLGQHPDRFFTGMVRNPVSSLPAMVSTTDIPEWCYCNALGAGVRPRTDGPSAADLERMMQVSPISHVSKVDAPILWMLGSKDQRVKPVDAMQYISAVRSRGHQVKLVVFPEDAHPLNKPQTEFECALTMAAWLKEQQ